MIAAKCKLKFYKKINILKKNKLWIFLFLILLGIADEFQNLINGEIEKT